MPYTNEIKIFIMIYSLNMFSIGFKNYFYSVFIVKHLFQYNAFFNVFNRLLYVSLSILFLEFDYGVSALIIISLISNFISLFMIIKTSRKYIKYRFIFFVFWDWKIIKPSIIFTLILFMGMMATRIDLIMISMFRPYSDVGIYAVVERLIEPVTIFHNYISISFFPIIIRLFKSKQINRNILFKASIALSIIALIVAGILSIFSKPIINIFFSNNYNESIGIFSILIFYMAISFMNIPFSLSLQALGKELLLLKIAWIPPLLNIFLNILFLNLFGLIGIAYSTLLVYTSNLILIGVIAWFNIKNGTSIINE
jgi:O-antigen/teichoic acid export membrane protein